MKTPKTMPKLYPVKLPGVPNVCRSLVRWTCGLLVFHFTISALGQGGISKRVPAGAPSAGVPSDKMEVGAAGLPAPDSDRLDVTDLEKKYWAAKDTDFSVVQNRLFSKAGRVSLSAGYGDLINDSWSDGPTFGLTGNYYFSERYGAELYFSSTAAKDSLATTQLASKQGGFPNHGKLKSAYGLTFNWVPFYAKVSVLNSRIIYFDMSFSPGLGMTEYSQQREDGHNSVLAPTFTFDISQHYFWNKWLALRVDLKNRWFNEEKVYYRLSSVPSGSSRNVSTDLNHTILWMLGLTFYY